MEIFVEIFPYGVLRVSFSLRAPPIGGDMVDLDFTVESAIVNLATFSAREPNFQ